MMKLVSKSKLSSVDDAYACPVLVFVVYNFLMYIGMFYFVPEFVHFATHARRVLADVVEGD